MHMLYGVASSISSYFGSWVLVSCCGLNCISLLTDDADVFSFACLLCVYLLGEVSVNYLPIFHWVEVCLFVCFHY